MKNRTFALSRVTLAICSWVCSSGVWAQTAAPSDTIARVEITAEKRLSCPRRSKFEPPCRPNIEPGVEADFSRAGCG